MKRNKGVVAFILFMTVCVFANAEITFGGWGRAVVTPYAVSGDHSAVSAATFTSGDSPSIGFTANGVAPAGKIGFKIDLAYGDGSAGLGDNAKIWVKPFEIFTLTAGFFKEEDLRGKIGASEFAAWILPNSSKGEDNIFQRFDAFAGAHFKIDPLKWLDSPWNDLTIQGAFGSNAPGSPGANVRAILNLLNNEDNDTLTSTYDESYSEYDGDRKVSAIDVYKAMQIAMGYRIPDIGLARVQFIGNNRNVFRWGEQGSVNQIYNLEKKIVTGMNTNRDADIIEAAFLFDGINGLKVDAGIKLPMEYTTKNDFIVYPRVLGTDGVVYNEIPNANHKEYTVQQPYVFALGISWTPDFLKALNLMARFDMSFGGSVKSDEDGKEIKNGSIMTAWIMPSFNITEEFKAGVDLGFDIHGVDTLKITGENPVKAQTDVSKYTDFGFGAWAELALGGGRIRTGVVVMIPGSPRYRYNASSQTYTYIPVFTGDPVISIPISFTYSF
jgi:hypothetical protein